MLTQIDQLLAAVSRAETVDDSVLIFIGAVSDQLAALRADLARRGDPTAELDLAIANLNAKSDAVVAAIKANTPSAGDPAPKPGDNPPPPPVVDPNTIPPVVPAPPPVVEAPPVVDPNTLPADPVDDTAPGEFPSLATWVAHHYMPESYEGAKEKFYADKAAASKPIDTATEPGQGEASMPVLDVAPAGQTSTDLNASGAVPAPKSPDELAAEHASDNPPDQH